MNRNLTQAGLLAIWLSTGMAQAQNMGLSGKWQVTISHHGSVEYAQSVSRCAAPMASRRMPCCDLQFTIDD